ncbi:MAG: hypothetical protein JXR97_10960 [Planctomycetes bacterium]|nr:hypothetical protein [Planctomycetota bacterium]
MSTGTENCPDCKGSGVSFNVPVPCPICDGKKTFPCTKCDKDGMVKCGKCKTRKINGESVRSIPNPEWKEWNDKYFGKSRDKNTPKEPEKYIKCTYCDGTGKVKCEACGGTKKAPCSRCKGTGTVSGKGPCPACTGAGKVACSACCALDGIEELDSIKVLDKMKKDGLVSNAEYYKKRRLIVAQEKYRRSVIEERKKKKAEIEENKAKAEAEKAAAEQAVADKAAEREEAKDAAAKAVKDKHDSLLKAFGTKIFSPMEYEDKVRALGLSEKEVRDAEKRAAETDPRVKQLFDLKEKFREGRYDRAEYLELLKNL